MKCDFCNNEAIGCTIQQYFSYCAAHKQEAEESAIDILNYIEWSESNEQFEQESDELIIE